MKIKCDYCDTYISDTEEKCPNCGAPNPNLARMGKGVPQTIEELQAFCAAHKLPLEKMRFFLGEDYRQPKAFGIYKDADGRFVVYKNKADGSRAVRYQGYDEAYAVNELYQKLRTEVSRQREYQAAKGSASGSRRTKSAGVAPTTLIAVALFIIISLIVSFMDARGKPNRGYYTYDNETYYYGGGRWYGYNDTLSSWFPTVITNDSDLYGNYGDYWAGSSYVDDWDVSDFSQSEYYDDTLEDTDWDDDDDWDWGGGDWDSGSTDWDSDW